jgi:hypothetical protein
MWTKDSGLASSISLQSGTSLGFSKQGSLVPMDKRLVNLLLSSNDFSNAAVWPRIGAGTITSGYASPDNNNNAWLANDTDVAVDQWRIEQVIAITPGVTQDYCLSLAVKQGTALTVALYAFFLGNSTKGSAIEYTFSSGVIVATAQDGGGIVPSAYGAIDLGNGYKRLYFVVRDTNSGLNSSLQFRLYPATRPAGQTGSVYIYGAQLELGNFPTLNFLQTALAA